MRKDKHSRQQAIELFRSRRLLARQLVPEDLQTLFEVYSDPEAMVWVDDGQPISYEDAVRWLGVTAGNYRTRGYGMSAILLQDTDTIIGFCGLVHPGGQEEVEIKYAFKREYWGQGFATETVRAMIAYGRAHHDIHDIMATTAPQNSASHAVLLKAGFRRGALIDNEDGSRTQVFEWHDGMEQ